MQSRREVAEFIGEHCIELAKIARQADCATLAHLLDMAALEAKEIESARKARYAAAPLCMGALAYFTSLRRLRALDLKPDTKFVDYLEERKKRWQR
jgi:hypothetical protein